MECSDVEEVLFSADSSLLAVLTMGVVQLWSIRTGELVHTLGDGWVETDAVLAQLAKPGGTAARLGRA